MDVPGDIQTNKIFNNIDVAFHEMRIKVYGTM